jgi:phosphoglycolate phosphatase-like HAD superfamily hydrolase
MLRPFSCVVLPALLLAVCFRVAPVQPQDQGASDPLPSWNAGANKQAILDFVKATTDNNSPKFVPVAQRIATFDNDGTLWVEQPVYTQLVFALDRVKALAPKHADWQSKEPFKAVLSGNREAMAKFTNKDLLEILAATSAGMSVEEFHSIAKDWLAATKHPRFKRLYTECVYEPMLEVMKLLRASGFKTYIVSGGGQAFMRAFADRVYGIPPEQVIGSAIKLKYGNQDGKPVMNRLPALLLLDDEDGKPEDIELFIGRKPLAAFGNSDGDRQMLEWTQSGGGTRLMVLVHHDDDQREYAYDAKSKIGTFSDSLMAEAKKSRWNVISMKNDWMRIFPFDAK